MKFLLTRVCKNPQLKNKDLLLSFDSSVWQSYENDDEIGKYFLDYYGCEYDGMDNEYFQPKNILSLNPRKNFIPCVLGVLDNDYNDWVCNGYEPNESIYKKSNLCFFGL